MEPNRIQHSQSFQPAKRPRAWPRVVLVLVAMAGAIVGAAYLAAPVNEWLQVNEWRSPSPGEETREFLKVFRRLLLIPLIAILVLACRPWRDGDLASYGLCPTLPRIRQLGVGYGSTLLTAILTVLVLMALGVLRLEDPPRIGTFASRSIKYVLTGLLVAVLEETFFRGWLHRRLSKHMNTVRAAALGAAIYAAVHAFRPGKLNQDVTLDASGALSAFQSWVTRLGDLQNFGPTLLGLFLFGLLLIALCKRTGSLWTSIGVHAAGIYAMNVHGSLTERVVREPWAGSKKLFNGVPGMVLLLLALWWVTRNEGDRETARDAAGRLT